MITDNFGMVQIRQATNGVILEIRPDSRDYAAVVVCPDTYVFNNFDDLANFLENMIVEDEDEIS
jgi:hypothetical protein